MLVRNLSFVVPYFGFVVVMKRKVYLFGAPEKMGRSGHKDIRFVDVVAK